jgi:hypothetical protein
MLEGNPYKVVVKKRRKRFKADAIGTAPLETYNLKTGEVRSAIQLVGSNKYYDTTDFIKFYEPGVLIGMSSEAVAVFAYIASRLQFGGYVLFNYEECMQYTNYHSRQSVYRGLIELKEKDVVRQKGRGEWWVNPNVIYRGQRDEI